jgi:glutamine synthetase
VERQAAGVQAALQGARRQRQLSGHAFEACFALRHQAQQDLADLPGQSRFALQLFDDPARWRKSAAAR